MGTMPPGQTIGYFVGIIAIIFAAYYVTLYVGKKASGQSIGKLRNKNINMIDRFALSRDKSFCLVEIGGKVYVVGITNHTMTLLDTLDAAAFTEAAAVQNPQAIYNVGGKYTAGMTKKLADFISQKIAKTPLGAEQKDPAGTPGPRFETFAENMKTAREKSPSGQSDDKNASRTDNSEEL